MDWWRAAARASQQGSRAPPRRSSLCGNVGWEGGGIEGIHMLAGAQRHVRARLEAGDARHTGDIGAYDKIERALGQRRAQVVPQQPPEVDARRRAEAGEEAVQHAVVQVSLHQTKQPAAAIGECHVRGATAGGEEATCARARS